MYSSIYVNSPCFTRYTYMKEACLHKVWKEMKYDMFMFTRPVYLRIYRGYGRICIKNIDGGWAFGDRMPCWFYIKKQGDLDKIEPRPQILQRRLTARRALLAK